AFCLIQPRPIHAFAPHYSHAISPPATMRRSMRIALGQINTTVGDLTGNAEKMMVFARRAAERGAEVIAFPELSLTGYPPRDLVEKPSFLERSECETLRLARETAHLPIAVICGYVG